MKIANEINPANTSRLGIFLGFPLNAVQQILSKPANKEDPVTAAYNVITLACDKLLGEGKTIEEIATKLSSALASSNNLDARNVFNDMMARVL